MLVEAHHRIEERNDHRMVLRHFTKGHAYITADRQSETGKWVISAVHANVLRKTADVHCDDRGEAIEAMQAMALEVLAQEPGDTDGPPSGRQHVVAEGETLESIAAEFKMSAQTLKYANPGVHSVTVGQEIHVPGFACIIPYHKELSDGSKILLHEKP